MTLRTGSIALGMLAALGAGGLRADDFDQEPILYATATPDNGVTRLQQRLADGSAQLAFDEEWGYLRSVLAALDVPAASQMLVFSKTSLQRQRIAPRHPRAVYFSDDVYIGYCQSGEVLEISAVDPRLGMVFYTLEQKAEAEPRFVRQTDNCLLCHASSATQGVPGNLVRSVYVDAGGQPILSSGTFRIDHTSPLAHRWGGWYVTGEHGAQKHLGNLVLHAKTPPEQIDNRAGHNVRDLQGRLRLDRYPTPHSDIVALMVLEHQATAHNLLIRANFSTRQALHYEAALNRDLKEADGKRWESTTSRIKSVGEPLTAYLLFSGEAPLTAPIQGTSVFAEGFAKTGPRDSRGRSLRDLDLQTRLFKYPCSYLIYSPSFDQLPAEVQSYVVKRMTEILSGRDQSPAYAHLSASDRTAIREILAETKPELFGE